MPTRSLTSVLAVLALALLSPLAAHAADASAEPSSDTRAAIDRAIASVLPALVRIHVVEVGYMSGREMKSEATGSGVIFTPGDWLYADADGVIVSPRRLHD